MSQNMNLITLVPSNDEDAVEAKCFSCGKAVKISAEDAAKINGDDTNGICEDCLAATVASKVSDATKDAADAIKTALGD